MIYLDSSVLVAFLYEATLRPERYAVVLRLVDAVRTGRIQAMISFYALPELYAYLSAQYSAAPFDTALRLSLIELFSIPLTIVSHLPRTEIEKWRHRISMSDSTDVPHVASALANRCNAIITFDDHFRQVSNLIPVYTPEEYLAKLESTQVG